MLVKELLPPEECPKGYLEDFADLLYRTQVQGVFRKDPEDKEKAVPAVRDDRIRKQRMSGGTSALSADQAADTEADLYRASVNKLDESPVVVAVDAATFTATVRAGLGFGPQMCHVFLEYQLSGPFFLDQLAIDQVLSYHNYALKTMPLSRLGHRPLTGHGRCVEEEQDRGGDGSSSIFFVSG